MAWVPTRRTMAAVTSCAMRNASTRDRIKSTRWSIPSADDDCGRDVGDDQCELEDRAKLQAGVGSSPRDETHVAPGSADSVDEQQSGGDAHDERADEEPAEDPTDLP